MTAKSSKIIELIDSLRDEKLAPKDLYARCESAIVVQKGAMLSNPGAASLIAVLAYLGGVIYDERAQLLTKSEHRQPLAYKLIDLWGRWLGLRGMGAELVSESNSPNDAMQAACMISALRSLAVDLLALQAGVGRASDVASGIDWAIGELASIEERHSLKSTLANGVEKLG